MLKERYARLFVFFLVMFAAFGLRFAYIQLFDGKSLLKSASAQRITNLEIEKPRGDILDRNLIPLTNRNNKYSIVLKPLYLKDSESSLAAISSMLDLDYAKLRHDVEIKREPLLFETVEAKRNLIMSLNLTGVSSITSLKRYDETSVARHLLGYLNKTDQVGEAGLEKYFESVLRNNTQNRVGVITDARNNLVQGLGYRLITPAAGEEKLNIMLTLDYHIQKITEDIMNRYGVKGAAVVQEVTSGDIMAITSKPDFDQNSIEKYLNSPDNELFNRAIASYNLGSIYKIIDAALILESGHSPEDEYFCTGSIKAGGMEFRCSNAGGHGTVNFEQAFAKSCNCYFINEGLKLGYRNLIEMASNMGMGANTGINGQGISESRGNLPDPASNYSKGDIANISIGQGAIMATPLQAVNLVSTIANGGIRNRVNILDSIADSVGNRVRSLKIKEGKRVISKETADRIKVFMQEVTRTGTGTKANLDDVGGAGGKTGSAETGNSDVVHAWFGGYFPAADPRYAVVVFVENGQYGGQVAAPIFADIAREILRLGL